MQPPRSVFRKFLQRPALISCYQSEAHNAYELRQQCTVDLEAYYCRYCREINNLVSETISFRSTESTSRIFKIFLHKLIRCTIYT